MTNRLPPSAQAPSTSESQSSYFSQRSRRQLGLFAAGAGFFAISSIITRRSLVRRYKATLPKFYQPSNLGNSEVNGAMEAFEALNIATINVLSVGMMMAGGVLYAFDISSLDDMRRHIHRGIGIDGPNGPRTDEESEKEIEEWIASVLHMGSKAEKEKKETKKPEDKEATILEIVSKLQENQGKGLDKDGIATILDRISKLEEQRKNDEERKS